MRHPSVVLLGGFSIQSPGFRELSCRVPNSGPIQNPKRTARECQRVATTPHLQRSSKNLYPKPRNMMKHVLDLI